MFKVKKIGDSEKTEIGAAANIDDSVSLASSVWFVLSASRNRLGATLISISVKR